MLVVVVVVELYKGVTYTCSFAFNSEAAMDETRGDSIACKRARLLNDTSIGIGEVEDKTLGEHFPKAIVRNIMRRAVRF